MLVGAEWRATGQRERGNLRAALRFWERCDDPLPGLRLALGVMGPWAAAGGYVECRDWLERFLARTPQHASAVRGSALAYAGQIARWQGDPERAVALHEELHALRLRLHDLPMAAHALGMLGLDHLAAGRDGRALAAAGGEPGARPRPRRRPPLAGGRRPAEPGDRGPRPG